MTTLEPGYHYLYLKNMLERLQFMCNEKRNKTEKEISIITDIAVTTDSWSSKSHFNCNHCSFSKNIDFLKTMYYVYP